MTVMHTTTTRCVLTRLSIDILTEDSDFGQGMLKGNVTLRSVQRNPVAMESPHSGEQVKVAAQLKLSRDSESRRFRPC